MLVEYTAQLGRKRLNESWLAAGYDVITVAPNVALDHAS